MYLRHVEAPVQREDGRDERRAGVGQAEVVGMAMDDVEVLRALVDAEEHGEVERNGIAIGVAQAKAPLTAGDEVRRGDRVPAREERNAVTATDELLGQIRDDALRAAVVVRRHTFEEWSDLSNTHSSETPRDPSASITSCTIGRLTSHRRGSSIRATRG